MSHIGLLPDNVHDQALQKAVHPEDWVNPKPAGRYNLVVIGGGPAGLVAALGAAGLGAKVAIIEKGLLGGDCLNAGCVPSKALLRVAHAAQAARDARKLNIAVGDVTPDFGAAMDRLRRIRAEIAPHDSAERLKKEGIDVFLGEAKFTGPGTVTVDGTPLEFTRCCIATGARPVLPPIPGIDTTDALTNEGIFALTTLPPRLTVIGAGVIGCELAQAFARLGSTVTVVDLAERVLPREDPDASAVVQAQLEADGIQLILGGKVARMEGGDDGDAVILDDDPRIVGDRILVAVGRRPNTELGLDAAGVDHGRQGIEVDDHLRTTNPQIYACGDVIGQAQFTHAADHQARIVVRNALVFGRAKVSDLIIPRVTYTHPELAAVGIGPEDAAKDPTIKSFTVSMGDTDRGRTDGESAGFCRVWADGHGRILGATIVGEHAGEVLAPLTLAMTHGLGLGQLATTIHPYPTRSEVVFKVASAWNRERFTPTLQKVSGWVMGALR